MSYCEVSSCYNSTDYSWNDYCSYNTTRKIVRYHPVFLIKNPRRINKGSTIKLTNEMSESNSKLGEKDNWLSDRIKTNIEIIPKHPCRVM